MLLFAAVLLFWTDPGTVSSIDFSLPARGATPPAEPFRFLQEPTAGTSAKILIRDNNGIEWQVKGGPEGRAEAFATRLVSAIGYYADSVLFFAKGQISGVTSSLRRAAGFVQPDGTFTWAAFERRDPDAKFLQDRHWKWSEAATREGNGLRILVMLLSNWDNKDATNTVLGANTGFIEDTRGTHAFVTDWGQSLGSWRRFRTGTNWDCEAYKRQTAQFILGVDDGVIRFGYKGQHTSSFTSGITVEDARWLLTYLGQVTDAQIRTGLLVSGATKHEEECFASSIRNRIETLRRTAALR